MSATPEPPARPEMNDQPPLLGSWRNIYALVIGALVFFIGAFSAITWAFS